VLWQSGVTAASFTDTGLTDGTTYYYEVTAVDSAGESARSSEVFATPLADWFSQNLVDPALQTLVRTDFNRDGSITRNDMIGIFDQVVSNGPNVSSVDFQDLRTIVSSSYLNMPAYVSNLAGKVVNGDPANASYLGQPLAPFQAGASSTVLTDLVNKWFLGLDLPALIDSQGNGGYSYTLASGPLWGTGGPSYQDVFQGLEVGDCYLLASLANVADHDPSIIENMFVNNGDGTYTVRFYQANDAAEYVTVNSYLPSGSFGASYSSVLWVALAEKAYAEISASGLNTRPDPVNSYYAINGGDGADTLEQITGQNGASLAFNNQAAFNAGLVAGDLVDEATGSSEPTGIVTDHEYAVLGYNSSTQTYTLLNPWGWNFGGPDPGILNETWAQLQAYFEFDGAVNPSGSSPSSLDQPILDHLGTALTPALFKPLGRNSTLPPTQHFGNSGLEASLATFASENGSTSRPLASLGSALGSFDGSLDDFFVQPNPWTTSYPDAS
jgi:Calpain family cysteine protease